MTDESDSQTEPWIEKHRVKYPYAYYKGSDLPRFARVRGIPAAMLIDPTGEVVWRGHPASLSDAVVEKALEGALPKPFFELGKAAKGVQKELAKGELAKALEEARELEAEGEGNGAEIRAAVEAMIKAHLEKLRRAREVGDFLRLSERGEALLDGLGDLPESVELQTWLDELDDDKSAQAVIAVQKKIRDLREDVAELRKQKDAAKLIDKLEKLAEEVPGSFAESQAKELISQLEALKAQLR